MTGPKFRPELYIIVHDERDELKPEDSRTAYGLREKDLGGLEPIGPWPLEVLATKEFDGFTGHHPLWDRATIIDANTSSATRALKALWDAVERRTL